MKKRLVLPIAWALAIGVLATSADAAKSPSPGSQCSPAGASRTVKGVKFTCVKNGKKSVWSSTKATPADSAPTTTTIPADSLSYKDKMIYGVKDAQLTRKASSGTYFDTDSRAVSAFSAIRQRAYSELNPANLSTSHPNIEFVYDIRPSFPASIIEYTKRELDLAAALWNHVFERKVQVRVALLTEQDREYIKGDAWYQISLFEDIPRHMTKFLDKTQRPYLGGGGGYRFNHGSRLGHILLYTASDIALGDLGPEWPQLARHEFFHVVQEFSVFRSGRFSFSSRTEANLLTPLHFGEGSANAVGFLTAFRTLGWASDALNSLLWTRSRYVHSWKTISSVDDAIEMMTATEHHEPSEAFEMSYAIGAVMYEWVIGTYGLDGFTKMLNQFATAANFDQVLQRSLGLTRSEFYAKVAPYVYETFKAANG